VNPTRRRRWTIVAFAAFAVAAAYPMQVNGWNQNAHYALVRALAQGTPTIDKTRHEIGDLGTGDVTLVGGHYYSNKAPGLALASVPAFWLLDAIGMRTTGDPTRVIWALHLWSIVLAAVLLLVLVRAVADTYAPGYGTTTALTLGLGTLVLPFSTLFFAHVLSAALGFVAFAALWAESRGRGGPWLVAAAGAAAGLAVTTEYTTAIVGLVLWLLVLARPPRVRRAALYVVGVVAGVLPLAAYNLWAFGSITHLSYEENQVEPIGGVLGVGVPSLAAMRDLLFSAWGLLTNMPVLALGVVGAVLLYRHGRRLEALVLLGVPALGFLHDSALQFSPFGGLGLPRYLIYTFPFVLAPLGLVYRRLPLTTLVLAAVSAIQMTLMTATNPLAAYDLDWAARLSRREFSQNGAAFVEVTGWYTIALFFAAVAIAAVAAVVVLPRARLETVDCVLAGGALAAWLVVAALARTPDGNRHELDYLVAVVIAAALPALAVGLLASPRRLRAQPG
jgi:hypothetical protein